MGFIGLPWATLGYLVLPWATFWRPLAALGGHGRAWATLGIIFLCARTFQGLHSVRLWTPTILNMVSNYAYNM
jgi:hypothetical protein